MPRTLLCILLAVSALTIPLQAAEYTIEDLGVCVPGGSSYGFGLNAAGTAVGRSDYCETMPWGAATIWYGSGTGQLLPGLDFDETEAYGLNTNGIAVGTAWNGFQDPFPVKWVQGALSVLPGGWGGALAINESGAIVGNSGYGPRASLWLDVDYPQWSLTAGRNDLGRGYATAISDSMMVAGLAWMSGPVTEGDHVVVWEADFSATAENPRPLTMQRISDDVWGGEVTGINEAGVVVGWATLDCGDPNIHPPGPRMWCKDGPSVWRLWNLYEATTGVYCGGQAARDINNNGQVVGGGGAALIWPSVNSLPVLLQSHTGMQNLPAGTWLEVANAINDEGVIVGTMRVPVPGHPDSTRTHAFRARPLPGTIGLIADPQPHIVADVQDAHTCVGGNVDFNLDLFPCLVSPTYTVTRNGVEIAWNSGLEAEPIGEDRYRLTFGINPVSVDDAGEYQFTVTSGCYSVTSRVATLRVGPPAIQSQPESVATCEGGSATFTVEATDVEQYQWWKDGAAIAGADGSSLTIALVRPGDVGSYYVVLTNACGSTTSESATLSIVPGAMPEITQQPESQEVCESETAVFTVVAENATGYQWLKDGTELPNENSASLLIPNVSSEHEGDYQVRVSSTCGSVLSDTATLTVASLCVTAQPQDQVVYATNPATFTCSVIGATGLQWRKDGEPIPGATQASYTISSVARSDVGLYDLIATDGTDSVTSSPARLICRDWDKWPRPLPKWRSRHAMAYDSVRQKTVLFGGYTDGQTTLGDTWEFDGETWEQLNPPLSPPARTVAAMTHDPDRDAALLFGGVTGIGGTRLNDLWAFDGQTWAELDDLPDTPWPSPRSSPCMVYDTQRDMVVMFGGYTTSANGETWLLQTNGWVQGPAGPPARHFAGAAFDQVSGQVVVFGGNSAAGQPLGDTWLFNGTAWVEWTQSTPTPSARRQPTMTYDSTLDACVLFGGNDGTADDETWVWTSSGGWVQQNIPPRPAAYFHVGVPHGGHMLVFGGLDSGGNPTDETWRLDGTFWTKLADFAPAKRAGHAMVTDPSGNTLLFGGGRMGMALADLWKWDGQSWSRLSPTGATPSGRSGHGLAFVGADKLLAAGGTLAETWLLESGAWRQVAGTAPTGSNGLAYDPVRGKAVMLDGNRTTWEWDPATEVWTQASYDAGMPRRGAVTCYDPQRQKVVLHGGDVWGVYSAATYAWDGQWSQLSTSGPARSGMAIAFDSDRSALVLFGGTDGWVRQTTHDWGPGASGWTQQMNSGPPGMSEHAMAYDQVRKQIVLYGSNGETWLLKEFAPPQP